MCFDHSGAGYCNQSILCEIQTYRIGSVVEQYLHRIHRFSPLRRLECGFEVPALGINIGAMSKQ